MKKHTLLSDIAVFLIIFLLFIVPPFFSSSLAEGNSLFTTWRFPWYQILLGIFGGAILYFYYQKKETDQNVYVAAGIWQKLTVFPVVFTFGMLFAISLFCRFLSEVTGFFDGDITVTKPSGVLPWIFCLINFLCAAFYEEVLYRFYFTDKLKDLIGVKLKWRVIPVLCEAAGLASFAFAHIYLGWISVLNAALAHIFLRLCYKKTTRLFPCVASHFIYNVISLILL